MIGNHPGNIGPCGKTWDIPKTWLKHITNAASLGKDGKPCQSKQYVDTYRKSAANMVNKY